MNSTDRRDDWKRRQVLGLAIIGMVGCGNGAEPAIDPSRGRTATAKRRADFGEPAGKGKAARRGG